MNTEKENLPTVGFITGAIPDEQSIIADWNALQDPIDGVEYRQGEDVLTEQYDTPDPLTTLLATQSPDLEVQTIETLDDAGTPKTQLYPLPTQ